MIGLVLAAGAGRRLRPLTAARRKALLEIGDARTVLDVVLATSPPWESMTSRS